jgi:uncharacterized protein
MGRLIVLVLIVVAAVWLLRRALRKAQGSDAGASGTSDTAGSQAEPKASQELVRCAHCALLLPRGEARMAAGVIYCSEEHARLGAGGRRSGG